MSQPNAQKWVSLVATNQMLIEISVFIRNVIIARLIGAETLGAFVFLLLILRLASMSTDLAVERYLIQTPARKLATALSSVHFINRIRGALLAIFIVLAGLTEMAGISFASYFILAFGVLLQGMTHQGYRLPQRGLNFRPAFVVEGFASLLGLMLVLVFALAAPSLEIICCAYVIQIFIQVALSHTLSQQPYHAGWDSAATVSALKFGLPLLMNGIVMFWTMQGERVILGASLSGEAFAHFSMLFQLALVPVLIVSRVILTAGLPVLSDCSGHPDQHRYKLNLLHKIIAAIAVIYLFGFVLFGNAVLALLFGETFRAPFAVVLLVAGTMAIRLCRSGVSVAAQSMGATHIPLKANLIRLSGLAFGLLLFVETQSLVILLFASCVSEGLALVGQFVFYASYLRGRHDKPKFLSQVRP